MNAAASDQVKGCNGCPKHMDLRSVDLIIIVPVRQASATVPVSSCSATRGVYPSCKEGSIDLPPPTRWVSSVSSLLDSYYNTLRERVFLRVHQARTGEELEKGGVNPIEFAT